jgi:hypothetical protein
VGGWSGYIVEHMNTSTLDKREHVTCLNIWLEKFIFYGKSFDPTSSFQIIVEHLAIGSSIPLELYTILRQVSVNLPTGRPIGTPGGPWWFINMWLNLHLHNSLE